MKEATSIKSKWQSMDSKRTAVLDRARRCAELTIPALMPPEGADENSALPQPYQSTGADGVNSLANKLATATFPTNIPFVRFDMTEKARRQFEQQGSVTETEQLLERLERDIVNMVDEGAMRAPIVYKWKLLLVTGNALIYTSDKPLGMKVYPLTNYCVTRDSMGNVLEIVIKEKLAIMAIPESVKDQVDLKEKKDTDQVDLYTYVYRVDEKENDHWEVKQAVDDVEIPESIGTYPLDACPWQAARYTEVAGENYGRGFVEEHIGDLSSLENLTAAIVKVAGLAAKVLFFKDPQGNTNVKIVSEAESGDFIIGRADEITVLQLQKYPDMQIAYQTKNEIEQKLQRAFMMMTSIQRNGERVTAEEIRTMANDIETGLGGVYSSYTRDFQLNFVNRLLAIRQKQTGGYLPKDLVKPVIITGMAALGRQSDLAKLQAFMQGIAPFKEELKFYLNVSDYIKRVAMGLGYDTTGLIRPEEEAKAMMQQEMQQAMMAQMTMQAAPGVAQEMTKGAYKAQQQNSTQQNQQIE